MCDPVQGLNSARLRQSVTETEDGRVKMDGRTNCERIVIGEKKGRKTHSKVLLLPLPPPLRQPQLVLPCRWERAFGARGAKMEREERWERMTKRLSR